MSRRTTQHGGRLTAAAAVIVGSLLGLSACGVPINASPSILPQSQLPVALRQSPPTTIGQQPSSKGFAVTVFFEQNGLLVAGAVEHLTTPTPTSVLRLLDSGPTTPDESAGIYTYLPPNARVSFVGRAAPNGDTAEINLGNTYFDNDSPSALVELAQIVYTLVDNSLGITQVEFFVNGNRIPVLAGSGLLVNGPVDECDYTPQLSTAIAPPTSCTPGHKKKPTISDI